ncbi:MAG TPA: hypothetical protein VJ770_07800 [Stellaceae bacterium]|nr:hypothetical protein [Stellaceae bacterium]
MRRWGLLGCALLALCGPVPVAWAQPGTSREAARVYGYCRAQADAAFQSERHIDQDIMATLGNNWQRAGTLPIVRSRMFDAAAGRAGAVLAGCLHAHGYARAG